jgi:hypothetical protein
MHFREILPCVFLVIVMLASALRAEDASDRAQDIAQMKRIYEALMAYKKARGGLPDQLGDLVPEFLPNAKDLLSPRDLAKEFDAGGKAIQPRSSYEYEWGPRRFRTLSVMEVRGCQLEEFGPVVPLLRRVYYRSVVNISHAGDFYETEGPWEYSPEVEKIIARRGLGPGASAGKFLELITADPTGAPVGGVRVTAHNRTVEGFGLPPRTLTTGDDGRVRIPFGPVDAMTGLLMFEKPGHFAFGEQSPKAGFPGTLRVTVSSAKPVGGIVTDPKGKPLANVTIILARELKAEEEDPKVQWYLRGRYRMVGTHRILAYRTGADGRWQLDSFPEQPELKVECVMSHPDYAVKVLTLDRAAMRRDGYFSEKAKVALSGPFRVRGKVVEVDGKPSANAAIFLYPSVDPTSDKNAPLQPVEAKTNAAGEFELSTRVPGNARIAVVSNPGGTLWREVLTMSPEMGFLHLKLAPGRVVKGKVINRGKQPVSGVDILFTGWVEDISVPLNPVVATTDAQGNWKWENAPTGAVSGSAILPSGTLTQWREKDGDASLITVSPEDEERPAEK